MPTNENTKVAFSATEIENLPSLSVTAPLFVPFSSTVTPGSTSLPDFTTPVTVLVWASRQTELASIATRIRPVFNVTDRRVLIIKFVLRVELFAQVLSKRLFISYK
jgi:hypothetical protein